MLNVYDAAHELVSSLKECDQYKNYKRAKNKIDSDPRLSKMINDFNEKGIQLQSLQMSGQTPDDEVLNQYKSLYGVVMSDPAAADFINSQLQITQIISDIYTMIGESLNE